MIFAEKWILKRRVLKELSLDKNQIIKKLMDFPIDSSSYYLIMGSALVMYGIKETTNDIDVGCISEAFDSLINNGFKPDKSRSGIDKIVFSQDINIYREWKTDYVLYINGIPVADLKSIMDDKIRFGRPKDTEDVKKIMEFIKTHHRNGESD